MRIRVPQRVDVSTVFRLCDLKKLFNRSQQRGLHVFNRLSCAARTDDKLKTFKDKVSDGPTLSDFIAASYARENPVDSGLAVDKPYVARRDKPAPYIDPKLLSGHGAKVFFETYGCQMNESDTEIASKILQEYNYKVVGTLEEADIILVMTCSIREGAETKIWNRLKHLTAKKKSQKLKQIGILGCMAERLKTRLLEKEKLVDVIAGPDSYRDLPNLLAINRISGNNAVNVLLSLDETYGDVMPTVVCSSDGVALNETPSNQMLQSKKAFLSIMRGCENMCSYCIVPYTRGKERSRSITSIVEEVRLLAEGGVREVTLLGQNVNSYRDTSTREIELITERLDLPAGFKSIYKPKSGGIRFHTLLEHVARVNSEVRIRFTSPHPKDFPPEVVDAIAQNHNLCKCIHIPAQSGSNVVLDRMRRGYTKEAYLDLVSDIRAKLPGVAFTSDFICGYCGETEEQHEETLDLLEKVKYNYVFVFPYSMREKTHAFHKHVDDVPEEVKKRRVNEVVEVFRRNALRLNQLMIGQEQLVLVEGRSKRSYWDLVGRNDLNIKVIFPQSKVQSEDGFREISPGDYVLVKIGSCTSQTLIGTPVRITTMSDFYLKRTPSPEAARLQSL